MLNEIGLLNSTGCKDLGVTVTTDLSWSSHLQNIIDRMLGLLRRTFGKSSSIETKKTLYLIMVRSKLSYCSQLWTPKIL